MSERCETDKTPQAKANATDKFNSIARHNQRHCLFDNAATTNQAIFSAIFNSLLDNKYTFEMCCDLVDEIVPIPEEGIAVAMRYCLDYEKVVLEGAGAASIAYVLESNDLSGKKIAAVCSGSNISKERLAAIFEEFGLS